MAEVNKIAQDEFQERKTVNTIIVGLILAIIDCDCLISGKISVDQKLAKPLQRGLELARSWKLIGKYPIKPKAKAHYRFNGNQALALGAIAGGCQFMAGYPMTPSTSIMDYFSKAALDLPIHF